MKHIGIVAHSAEGAALCYRTMCHEGFRRLGEHHHPEITMSSIAMGLSMEAWERGDLDTVAAVLMRGAHAVRAAGADFFVIPDNTAHIALAALREAPPLPLLHIADVVCDRAVTDGCRMVGVLGTNWTMDGPVYRDGLAARGVGHMIPEQRDRQRVHEIIFAELVAGVFTDRARAFHLEVIERLRDRGCDAVILGCTEIPLLVPAEASALPTLDSTRLLARAAVAYALDSVDDGER